MEATYPFLIAKMLEYTTILELFFSNDGFAVTQLDITIKSDKKKVRLEKIDR